ncbi:unnamed protein product [Diplocarpon coronariae]
MLHIGVRMALSTCATRKEKNEKSEKNADRRYSLNRNINGWTIKQATKLGATLGAFGGVAGVFAIFFFAEVPKVRNDIMVKIPIIGQHFIKEIPASDNVCQRGAQIAMPVIL